MQRSKDKGRALLFFAAATFVGVGATFSSAAVVTQTTGDLVTESSIFNGTHFPGGIVAGTDYLTPTGVSIRTAADTLTRTFGGASLEIDGTFNDKSRGGTNTFADLRFNGGTYSANRDNSGAQILAGNINLLGPALFDSTTGALVFTSTISARFTGTGALTVSMTGAAGSQYTFSNSANNYSGGTSLTAGLLEVTQNGGLGTGNVTVTGTSTLRLDATGTIAANAKLSLAAGATADLAFVGTNTVNGLTLGGAVMPSGVYSTANSGGFLTGAGSLTVVPEPVAIGFIGILAMGLIARRRHQPRLI